MLPLSRRKGPKGWPFSPCSRFEPIPRQAISKTPFLTGSFTLTQSPFGRDQILDLGLAWLNLGKLEAVLISALAFTVTLTAPQNPIAQTAFAKALENVLSINRIQYDPKHFDKSGLLDGKLGKFLRAGGDYQEPWTRDASINSWNAASLLEPQIAKNTLYAVLDKNEKGEPIVQPDNQWWDKVIWIYGAWNHYLVTGDREFLKVSYGVATRLLALMRKDHFDSEFGLFKGPSFFNDGIAGSPAPPAPAEDTGSTFVLDHPNTDRIMALSTNCLYVAGYRTAAKMAAELGEPKGEEEKLAAELTQTIRKRFWMPKDGRFGYFIHGAAPLRGQLDASQEGTGLSYAILFDIATPAQARSILSRTHREPLGIVDVYPHFERYSDAHPGRHNVLVWPVVQGLWARAAAHQRDLKVFNEELTHLTQLAQGSQWNFYEIYDGKSGKVEGGWQSGIHFGSVPHQTWSASAYLSMVLNGVFGLRFSTTGLTFQPLVPAEWSGAKLTGIAYRNATLDIQIKGQGSHLASLTLDGVPSITGKIAPSLRGKHTVELVVE